MAKTGTESASTWRSAKYEERLRNYPQLRKISMGRVGLPAGERDAIADLIAAAREVDQLRMTGFVTFEASHAERAFDALWTALATLDRRAQP